MIMLCVNLFILNQVITTMKSNRAILVVLSFFLVSGCTLTAKDMISSGAVDKMIRTALEEQRAELEKKEIEISFSLLAAPDVNHRANAINNDWQESRYGTPISIKILQLTDDSMLLSADQESLNEDLESALGKTYIDHSDYVLTPRQFKFVDFEITNKKTRYIGVIADYHDINKATWKKTVRLDSRNKKQSLLVHLTMQEILIKTEDSKMSMQNQVIWSEGLFIKPQHFQQEARYFDYLLNQRIRSTGDYLYGFSTLEINQESLTFGKISLLSTSGVMPDGSVFEIPLHTASPEPLTVDDVSLIGQVVYLAIPLHSAGTSEVQWPESMGRNRYLPEQHEIRDLHSKDGNHALLHTAKLNACLLLERDNRSAYTCLALGRIRSVGADSSIALDENFYPTSLSVNAIPPLRRFLDDVTGLVHARAQHLATQVNSPRQSGVADVTDFMLLQTLNRLYPQFQHLGRLKQLHPERLYEVFSSASGELATFNEKQRVPKEYPAYFHDDCQSSFEPLLDAIRRGLGAISQAKAINIPINKQQYGNWSAPVHERGLFETADFILAVKAQVPTERLLTEFPQQAKVSSLEDIGQLISLQLPGVPLKSLPVAPRQLPYHAGFSYFQLDRNHPAFDKIIASSAGFGFHIAASLPELELQFWAIREMA